MADTWVYITQKGISQQFGQMCTYDLKLNLKESRKEERMKGGKIDMGRKEDEGNVSNLYNVVLLFGPVHFPYFFSKLQYMTNYIAIT